MATNYRALRRKWENCLKNTSTLTEKAAKQKSDDKMDHTKVSDTITRLQKQLSIANELEQQILPLLDGHDESELIMYVDEHDKVTQRIEKALRQLAKSLRKAMPKTENGKRDTSSSLDAAQPTQETISTLTHSQQATNLVPSSVQASMPAPTPPEAIVSQITPAAAIETQHPTPPQSSMPSYHKHRFNLPKLSLPTFDGNPMNWVSFFDKFNAAIHSDSSLAEVEKLQYLTANLIGDAAQLVEGLAITNNNYQEALDLLKQRYGRTEILITSYMNAIVNMRPPLNTAQSLREFHDQIESHIRSLKGLGEMNQMNHSVLVSIIRQKLPMAVQTQMYRESQTGTWDLTQLMQAILKETNAQCCGHITHPMQAETQNYASASSFVVNHENNKSNRPPKQQKNFRPTQRKLSCAYCNDGHLSAQCQVVTDANKRKDILKSKRRCFNCLSTNHTVKACYSKFSCRNCNLKHHTSICQAQNTQTQKFSSAETAPKHTSKPDSSAHVALTPASNAVLLKTATAEVQHGNHKARLNILLDEGSQRTFITAAASQRLGINEETCKTIDINLSTFGDKTSKQCNYPVTPLQLITREGKLKFDAIIVPNIASPVRNYVPQVKTYHHYLKMLPLATHTKQRELTIDILIGADFFWSLVKNHIVRGPGPTAVSSKLGYLLSGPANCPSLPTGETNVMTSTCLKVIAERNQELNDICAQFWDLETLGIKDTPKESTFQLEDYCNNNIHRDTDGKYVAKLPWKTEHAPLPSNFKVANARTRSMIRNSDATTLNTYDSIIKDQLRNDFIEEVPNSNPSAGHYIPHHSVKKDSPTTPIRIVYDCSSSSRNAPSLNDCLETGTDLGNDMLAILLRFRTHAIAFTSDIEKAFLNVRLHESDRDFTKFLWLSDRTNPESELSTFRFKSVLFGSTSSPFILNAVLKKHLSQYDNPVAQDIQSNLYVDNLLTGISDSITQKLETLKSCTVRAIDFYNQANEIMNDAGFTLRSWATNDKTLRATITTDHKGDEETIVNTLGLRWNTQNDNITYPPSSNLPYALITKRIVLKSTGSLFDPLGWLSPVHVRAKIFIQQLWLLKLTWDDPLPNELASQWGNIQEELCAARTISVPRRYFNIVDDTPVELHIFCDASIHAYGAAAYLKYKYFVSLAMAKTRIKPLKDITLPRLELMATLIGARLSKFMTNAFKSSHLQISSCTLWTDSEIVLHWLTCDKKLPVFVSNRVQEIQNAGFSAYKHCPTTENPADLLTRGIKTTHLHASRLWWQGPHWLPTFATNPDKNDSHTILCCIEPTCDFNTTFFTQVLATNASQDAQRISPAMREVTSPETKADLNAVINIESFSDLDILLHVTAYVMRFIRRVRAQARPRSTTQNQAYLLPSEIIEAERLWTRQVQTRYYCDESRGKSTTLVRQLRLFLDEHGFLRTRHRLQLSNLPYHVKFPILLPTKAYFTTLIITQAHKQLMHAGTGELINYLRQKYWIPQLRRQVKSLVRKCVTCRKVTGKPYAVPPEPPLPPCRIQETAPFTVTGIDFTGALYYSNACSSSNKCYICLFTCAVTRNIHLELVLDMSTESFLRAFQRFACRRSMPSFIITDNSSTFTAASQLIQQAVENDTCKKFFADHRIQWSFIPKSAPWFGGFYERLIGVTKTALRKALGKATVTFDELQTIVVQAESIINDRPLTTLHDGPDDSLALTPSHLLYGRQLNSLPKLFSDNLDWDDPTYDPSSRAVNKRLQQLQKILADFWQQWRDEYLPVLRERHQTTKGRGRTYDNKIKVGDVVLVRSDVDKRIHWPLAMVTELEIGADGFVRSATIRTRNGKTTNRPISKLYPLEVTAVLQDETSGSNMNPDKDVLPTQRAPRPARRAAQDARMNIHLQKQLGNT